MRKCSRAPRCGRARGAGGGPAHGYAIIETIKTRSGGTFDLPEGTVYPALHRLEQAGLLSSAWTTPPSGRRRRVYSLTKAGTAALRERRKSWGRFSQAVDAAFEEGAHGRPDRRLCRRAAPRARLRSCAGRPAGERGRGSSARSSGSRSGLAVGRGRAPRGRTLRPGREIAAQFAATRSIDRRAVHGSR